jgi:hypothetical protein
MCSTQVELKLHPCAGRSNMWMVCLDRNNLGMLQTIRKVGKVTKRGNGSGQPDKPAPTLECTYIFFFFFSDTWSNSVLGRY